jgi:hypothetical protein
VRYHEVNDKGEPEQMREKKRSAHQPVDHRFAPTPNVARVRPGGPGATRRSPWAICGRDVHPNRAQQDQIERQAETEGLVEAWQGIRYPSD